jgi:hypothetical protein
MRYPGCNWRTAEDSGHGGDVQPEKQEPKRKNREKPSIGESEDCALSFLADAVQRFINV